MEQKTNKILVVIIIILVLLIILLSTGVINFNKDKYSNYETNNEITNNNDYSNSTENNSDDEVSNNTINNEGNNNIENNESNDLSVYWLVDNKMITEEKTTDLTFKITADRKISINNNKSIANITNAKSIKLFSPPGPYSTLYILTKDGNIYKYETSELEKENYNASKVDNYTNVKEIVTYQKRSTENKGHCEYIVVIDNNGKHYKLDSMCI